MFEPELRLLLIRHGEAIANRDGAFLGRRNDPLTPRGGEQARALAERLKGQHIDALYSSPLERALTTARTIAKERMLEPMLNQALIEQDFGTWDGLPVATVLTDNADTLRAWRTGGPGTRPPEGEALQEVADRVYDFFSTVRNQHTNGQIIAMVGHGGAFQALLCRIFAIPLRPLWPFKLALASVTEVTFTQGAPSLTRLSA